MNNVRDTLFLLVTLATWLTGLSLTLAEPHEPTAAECASVGGKMVEGTGCVVDPSEEHCSEAGAEWVEGSGCVKEATPAEVQTYCKEEGSRYNAALNACESD